MGSQILRGYKKEGDGHKKEMEDFLVYMYNRYGDYSMRRLLLVSGECIRRFL